VLKINPHKKNIKVIDRAFNSGFNIILYTARYRRRCKENLAKVSRQIKPLTIKKLGCKIS
jgi:hypothetical protein